MESKIKKEKEVLYLGNFNSVRSFAAFNRAIGISKIFNHLDYKVHFVVNNDDTALLSSIYSDMNIKFHNILLSKKKFYFSSAVFMELIKTINNLTHVVLYNFPSLATLPIISYCKKNNIKIIGDITEWYDTSNVSLFMKPIKWLDTSFRMRVFNKKMDGLIVISDYLYNFYKKSRVEIIKILPTMDSYENLTRKNNNDVLTIGYAGFAGKKKENIIKCIEDVFLKNIDKKMVRFEFIGKIDMKVIQYLEENHILYNYYGWISHDLTIEKLLTCDCEIIFRHKNRTNNAGFPSKFAEAVSLGLPIIRNNFSDLESFKSPFIYSIDSNEVPFNAFVDFIKKNKECDYVFKNQFKSSYYFDAFSNFLEKIQNC